MESTSYWLLQRKEKCFVTFYHVIKKYIWKIINCQFGRNMNSLYICRKRTFFFILLSHEIALDYKYYI